MLDELKKEFQILSMNLEEKKLYMSTLRACLPTVRNKPAEEEQENEVLERNNDDLVGGDSCSKRKKSRRAFEVILSTVPKSLIGVALTSERYI